MQPLLMFLNEGSILGRFCAKDSLSPFFPFPMAFATIALTLVAGVLQVSCDRQEPPKASSPTSAASPAPEQSESGVTAAAQQPLPRDLAQIFALIKDRQSGPARVRLRNWLELHPNDGQACFLFGLTYHREKKYGEARPWFEKAIANAPDYAVSHYFLGWTLYWLGELTPARREFETYLQSNPGEHDSHFALGLISLDEDDLAGAERLFKRSIDLLNESKLDDKAALSRAKARLGEVYERTDRLEDARRELEEAVALYPDHYEALYKLYRVLVRLGQTQRADEVHKQYIATRERVRPGTSFPE